MSAALDRLAKLCANANISSAAGTAVPLAAFGSNAAAAASNYGYATLAPQAAFGSNVAAAVNTGYGALAVQINYTSNQAFITLPALISSAPVVTSSNTYTFDVPSNQPFGPYPSPRLMNYSTFSGTVGTVDGRTGKQLGSTGVYLLNDSNSFYNSKTTAVPIKIYTAPNDDTSAGQACRIHRVCIGSNTSIEYSIPRNMSNTIGCETFFNYGGSATPTTFTLPPKQFFRVAFSTNDTAAIYGLGPGWMLYTGTMYVVA